MTDYVPQILTVVGTLAGSLGGVALTQRHQRQMVRMERAEKRRAELRTHIVEFLTNADEWASHMDITIIVVWKTTERDMVELSNSGETANRAGELRYAVTKELKHLIGLAGDPYLQEGVSAFHDLWLNVAEQKIRNRSGGGRSDAGGQHGAHSLADRTESPGKTLAVRGAGTNDEARPREARAQTLSATLCGRVPPQRNITIQLTPRSAKCGHGARSIGW